MVTILVLFQFWMLKIIISEEDSSGWEDPNINKVFALEDYIRLPKIPPQKLEQQQMVNNTKIFRMSTLKTVHNANWKK